MKNPNLKDAEQRLISALQECRQEAARLRLWKTYNDLGEPLSTIGWEIAEREGKGGKRKS